MNLYRSHRRKVDTSKQSKELHLIDESLNETCEIEIDPNALDVAQTAVTPKEVSMPMLEGHVYGRRGTLDFKKHRKDK